MKYAKRFFSRHLLLTLTLLFGLVGFAQANEAQVKKVLAMDVAPDGIVFEVVSGDKAYLKTALDRFEAYQKQLKEKFGAENQDNFNAEFCSECGCSHKDAEEFAAETSGGNQVFNSCWKCGSGQHLYQIARYPATASEIAGVGGNPEEVSEGGKQRAGN